MTRNRFMGAVLAAVFIFSSGKVFADQPGHDLSTEKVLYVVGTAHLDTQWRWTIQDTINDYIKKTLDENFALFEQYPDYVFSFEGAFRYMLMKEYYPARYARMSDYIEAGRWAVGGSTFENGDMNVVSPEALIRQTLIGNNYFEDEFGKRSTDIFLPDCFGFSYTMPTWMSHCGLNGFSSQKLSWGGAVPTPFDIGVWKGPDGSSIIAALNPGGYGSKVDSDLSTDNGWLNTINSLGDNHGVYAGYKYHGTGDTGGSPGSSSCQWLETSIAGTGPITVLSARSDQLYNDITPEQKAGLEVYDGELLMRTHGTGCYTSQTAMKRWNRQNELLADSAERAAVMADWLGSASYPADTLRSAWMRFLWHTFHDDITGTSIPSAYHFSWNDEALSLNQFAGVLDNSISSLSASADTNVEGRAVVVYNPLSFYRSDIATATLKYEAAVPQSVAVFDGSVEVPSQILGRDSGSLTLAFLAGVPSVGYRVFDVREMEPAAASALSVTSNQLENEKYRVTVNESGDIASIWDKAAGREVLAAPSRIELLSDVSTAWPAWEVMYSDVQASPYAYVSGPAEIEIAESGPLRVALKVTRKFVSGNGTSTFVQTISLGTGNAGYAVIVDTLVDWRALSTLVKASFPLAVSNSRATYDLGMGTITRTNNTSDTYEVPAQQWADITDSSGDYGVSILNDSKYGWDKPADNVLRLTLLHTPGVGGGYSDEATQDNGQHKFTYAIYPHTGSWSGKAVPKKAARLNQPLTAFAADKHAGALGRSWSLLDVTGSNVIVKAIKKAERSDEYIVRVQEISGESASGIQISSDAGIASAREVDGCERPVGVAVVNNGALVFDISKYQPKTFAITLKPASFSAQGVSAARVNMAYNLDAFSYDSARSDGNFYNGTTWPAELISDTVEVDGISFAIGSRANGSKNALACDGRTVSFAPGYSALYILAAARGGDTNGSFTVSGVSSDFTVQDYAANIADWGREEDVPFIKRDRAAYIGTHTHQTSGNIAYKFCNMFMYRVELPAGATSVTLPDNSNIVVFAMTVASSPADGAEPAVLLYDELPYMPALAPKPETRTNLAKGKTASADKFITAEYPGLAVDGTTDSNSKWCCNTGKIEPHWLVVDLGGNYDVDTFVLRHAGDGGENTNWNTREYCIQYSEDGQSGWTDLVCETDNQANVARYTITPANVRWLRVYITNPSQDGDSAVRLYEFEVYGPCDGTWIQGDISGADGQPDCKVDIDDFSLMAAHWIECNDPGTADCMPYWTARFAAGGASAQLPGSESAEPPASALEGSWRMSEGTGTTVADWTDVNDKATLQGGPLWQGGWVPAYGSGNYSVYFDSSDYASVSAGSGLSGITAALTICAWIKPEDWNGNRRIIQKGDSDNQYRLLAENGSLKFDIYNVGTVTCELPETGLWHHIAGVWDGSRISLYVDGVTRASSYASGSINQTSSTLYIATKTPAAPSGDHFKGNLDDIRIYSAGLSEAQLRYITRLGQNAPPVVLEIHKPDDTISSLTGICPLDAVVYDVNADTLACSWSEQNSSAAITFSPSNQVEDPQVLFSSAGDYRFNLNVTDANGASATAGVDAGLSVFDCAAVRTMNYKLEGDINGDCFTGLEDLAFLLSGWLTSAS